MTRFKVVAPSATHARNAIICLFLLQLLLLLLWGEHEDCCLLPFQDVHGSSMHTGSVERLAPLYAAKT